MRQKQLKNKPLVEAVLELRWPLVQNAAGLVADPHYNLLLGRLYDRLLNDYPVHEPLPTSQMPEIFSGQVQHRFRPSGNGWPLVQIGPGVLTLNSTSEYVWDDFRARALRVIDKLYDAHPKPAELNISTISLRYINSVEFDYWQSSVYGFLKEKLKVSVELPANLFEGTRVEKLPSMFTWQSTFECSPPSGQVTLTFSAGEREEKPAIFWDTLVHSSDEDELPSLPGGFADWIDAAHLITDDWFFKLIEGELERRFSGE